MCMSISAAAYTRLVLSNAVDHDNMLTLWKEARHKYHTCLLNRCLLNQHHEICILSVYVQYGPGPAPQMATVSPSETLAKSTANHAVAKMSDKKRALLSDMSEGTLIKLRSAARPSNKIVSMLTRDSNDSDTDTLMTNQSMASLM